MCYLKRTLAILATAGPLIAPSLISAATVTLSFVRLDVPDDFWSQYTAATEQYEAIINEEAEDYTYHVQSDEDSIDFVFDFPEGWDYNFYYYWENSVIPTLNQAYAEGDAGVRWEISFDGEVSAESNPWREVNWLENVWILGGNYLWTEGFGYLYAENWKPEGGFWAYAYNLAASWLYVFGRGWYYDEDAAAWYYNWPGTRWFYDADEDSWFEMSTGG